MSCSNGHEPTFGLCRPPPGVHSIRTVHAADVGALTAKRCQREAITGPVNGVWGFSGASSVEWSRGKQIVGLELILPCHFSSTELCGEPPLPGGE